MLGGGGAGVGELCFGLTLDLLQAFTVRPCDRQVTLGFSNPSFGRSLGLTDLGQTLLAGSQLCGQFLAFGGGPPGRDSLLFLLLLQMLQRSLGLLHRLGQFLDLSRRGCPLSLSLLQLFLTGRQFVGQFLTLRGGPTSRCSLLIAFFLELLQLLLGLRLTLLLAGLLGFGLLMPLLGRLQSLLGFL